jgi:predicted methyltransferase
VLLLLLPLVAPGPAFSAAGEKKGKPGPSAAPAKTKPKADPAAAKAAAEKAKKRAEALHRLAARLGLGKGGTVADIGAGSGQDTWVFAEIVGPTGKVYAEEVTEKLTKSLQGAGEKRKLPQVRAVLGRDDDPALPRDAVDLAYMRMVYHHLSKPREMLRGIWRALKPGGYFVVIDQHKGTLRDWVPREQRKDKHFWLAETTVVREAREEGFAFVACAEDCCDVLEPFVLIFQRPKDLIEPGRDPDCFLPLAVKEVAPRLLPPGEPHQNPVFVALGEARQLMRPVLERSVGKGMEIVLEEWATQKEERPPLPPGVNLPSVLTDQGDPRLGPEPISVVFFLDSYHLLFHGKTLLGKLRERLAPDGCVYVLDREAKEPLSRREASHRRRIRQETVKQEMAAAGFSFWFEGPRPAPDRFLLVFGKVQCDKVRPNADL